MIDLLENISTYMDEKQKSIFFDKALSSYKNEYNILNESLNTEQWEQSAKHAHRLKGTCALLNLTEMIELLEVIIAQNTTIIATKNFQGKLEKHYQSNLLKLKNITIS